MRLVRWLAWSMGILFLLGAVLTAVDVLNLYKTPPDIPESLNMVELRLAVQDYRISIWPLFLLSYLLPAIGFIALSGLGLALASQLRRDEVLRIVIPASAGVAGILGAVGQFVVIGVTEVTIDQSYCDCGFRDAEIVSQIWGQMLAEGASRWLVNAALVLGAVAVAATGTAFRDRMPPAWNLLSWLTAFGLVASVVIPMFQISPDLDLWTFLVVAGAIVPIWAIWLGTALRADDEPELTEA